MNNTAFISRLQHFSTGDGDGIRTTVFLQGCNLRCRWCHNPETIDPGGSLLVYDRLCVKCGACVSGCPQGAHRLSGDKHIWDRARCTLCGVCADICPQEAIVQSGQEMDVDEIWHYILEDKAFYDATNGGVTLSGGEPLLQSKFCAALAKRCMENQISVYVDTAACVPFERFEDVIPFTTKFLVDLKANSEADYAAWTGGSAKTVIDNLKKLRAAGCDVLIRIPVIPGWNGSKAYLSACADMMQEIGFLDVELLPFHKLGSAKYTALQTSFELDDVAPPGDETMRQLKRFLAEKGFNVK